MSARTSARGQYRNRANHLFCHTPGHFLEELPEDRRNKKPINSEWNQLSKARKLCPCFYAERAWTQICNVLSTLPGLGTAPAFPYVYTTLCHLVLIACTGRDTAMNASVVSVFVWLLQGILDETEDICSGSSPTGFLTPCRGLAWPEVSAGDRAQCDPSWSPVRPELISNVSLYSHCRPQ